MATTKPRVRLPKQARKGEIIEIRTLISHEMESGQRKDREGRPIPRKIINRFESYYNGKLVFSMDLFPAISSNPYIAFRVKVEEPGEFEFRWVDDDGSVYSTKSAIEVDGA